MSPFDYEKQKHVSFVDILAIGSRTTQVVVRRFDYEKQVFEHYKLKLECLPARLEGPYYSIPESTKVLTSAIMEDRYDPIGVLQVLPQLNVKIESKIADLKERLQKLHLVARDKKRAR